MTSTTFKVFNKGVIYLTVQLKYPKNTPQFIALNLLLVNLVHLIHMNLPLELDIILRRVAISRSSKRGTHEILDLLHRKTCSICDN